MNDCQWILLAEIVNGRTGFLVDSTSEFDQERFQFIVSELDSLEQEGLIKITRRCREVFSKHNYCYAVWVRLTEEGKKQFGIAPRQRKEPS